MRRANGERQRIAVADELQVVAGRVVEVQRRLAGKSELERPFGGDSVRLEHHLPGKHLAWRDTEREVRMARGGRGLPAALLEQVDARATREVHRDVEGAVALVV